MVVAAIELPLIEYRPSKWPECPIYKGPNSSSSSVVDACDSTAKLLQTSAIVEPRMPFQKVAKGSIEVVDGIDEDSAKVSARAAEYAAEPTPFAGVGKACEQHAKG